MIQVLAYLTMIVDHLGQVFFPGLWWFQLIGRAAFPLFAWTVGIGAIKSRNLDRYIFRVLGLGVLSQWPYAMLFPGHLNICFTLGLALVLYRSLINLDWWGGAALVFPLVVPVSYGLPGVLLVLSSCLAVRLDRVELAFPGLILLAWFCHGWIPWGVYLFIIGASLFLASLWTGNRWLPGRLAYWIYPGHLAFFAICRFVFIAT